MEHLADAFTAAAFAFAVAWIVVEAIRAGIGGRR